MQVCAAFVLVHLVYLTLGTQVMRVARGMARGFSAGGRFHGIEELCRVVRREPVQIGAAVNAIICRRPVYFVWSVTNGRYRVS